MQMQHWYVAWIGGVKSSCIFMKRCSDAVLKLFSKIKLPAAWVCCKSLNSGRCWDEFPITYVRIIQEFIALLVHIDVRELVLGAEIHFETIYLTICHVLSSNVPLPLAIPRQLQLHGLRRCFIIIGSRCTLRCRQIHPITVLPFVFNDVVRCETSFRGCWSLLNWPFLASWLGEIEQLDTIIWAFKGVWCQIFAVFLRCTTGAVVVGLGLETKDSIVLAVENLLFGETLRCIGFHLPPAAAVTLLCSPCIYTSIA